MTPAFLLWLLPGYVVHLFHKSIRSVRNSSGWDFIALSGLYSACLYVACMATKVALLPWGDALVPWEARVVELMHLPEACGLLPLAWLYTFVWGVCVVRRKAVQRLAWRIWPGDPYLEFVRRFTEQQIILSLKSGKVYVGMLKGATFDVNEAARSLTLAVELSGYRRRDTHQVVFDKVYSGYQIPSHLRAALFPYGEIATISPFSYDLHEQFVLSGVTLMGSAESREPSPPEPASGPPERPATDTRH